MNAVWLRSLSAAAVVSLVASAAQATPIVGAQVLGYDLVKVGDAGNAAQSGAGTNQNGFGAVATEFWIGKYQVTIGQYAEFLNAVAKSDPRGLWDANMGSDARIRGIERSGNDGSYVYTVVGPSGTNPVGAQSAANRPISFVSWFDSARFANWMSNGKVLNPVDQTAALALIDDGAYTLGNATTGLAVAKNAINPNTGAAPTFYIPTENEWYKAAYYSPVKSGPTTPGYYLYGTKSDTAPGNGWDETTALANKDLPNQANYRIDSRFAVTGATGTPVDQNLLTDVGTFTNSFSYYGAFDMSGNLWEWNDLNGLAGSRAVRGGRSASNAADVSSTGRFTSSNGDWNTPANSGVGFRLASPVPEPATLGMASGGLLLAGGWWILKRRRRAR